ncbi:MAG: glycosyltransferase family 61 protein [Magnetococcus sp. MYC-9]
MAIPFDLHKSFQGERAKLCPAPRIMGPFSIFPQTLSDEMRIRKHAMLAELYNTVSMERMGTLHGEYVVLLNGLALMDREGTFIITGTDSGDLAHKAVLNHLGTLKTDFITDLMQRWESIPMAHQVAVLSDRFEDNYYHFSLEVVPRQRHFDGHGIENVLIPESFIGKPFKRDLILRTVSGRVILLAHPMRVSDPFLVFGGVSADSIRWLRRRMNIAVRGGSKRYYIHRGSSLSRAGGAGGILEDLHLKKFLDHFGFQTVDFGTGEYSIDEQVHMLEGAQILLSAHGAHLTNMVYLNPPLTLIEILGPEMSNFAYLRIAKELAFDYYGVMSHWVDDRGNIRVDCEELRKIMAEILS